MDSIAVELDRDLITQRSQERLARLVNKLTSYLVEAFISGLAAGSVSRLICLQIATVSAKSGTVGEPIAGLTISR